MRPRVEDQADRRQARRAQDQGGARRVPAAAEKAFEKSSGKTGGDEGGARYYYGLAKIAQADKDYEEYLGLTFPQNLNFDPAPEHKAIKEKSLKRFNDWFEQEEEESACAASQKYENVLDDQGRRELDRRGGAPRPDHAELLGRAVHGRDPEGRPHRRVRRREGRGVLRHADREGAEPLEAGVARRVRRVPGKSTELGWFSEWSKLCERELGQIKPEEFPTASELRGDPDAGRPGHRGRAPDQKLD